MERFNEYSQHITLAEALMEYCRNEEFRQCLDSESIVYVEGAFVFDSPQTVQRVGEKLCLTEHARKHLENCALSFSVKLDYKPDRSFNKQETFGRGKVVLHPQRN